MPIYEYRCEKCGKVIEALQRFSDAPLKIHEACGGELEKLISHSAFQLKGSGWYASDYAKGSAAAPVVKGEGVSEAKSSDTKAESKTEASTESKGESKTETKSDAKSDAKPAASTTVKTD